MSWRIEFVSIEAEREVAALPKDMQAKLAHIARLIETFSLERVREPYLKHLVGDLWEMRLTGRAGIARSIYMTASGRRIVILRTFVKKTEKTPQRELALAFRRAKEAP